MLDERTALENTVGERYVIERPIGRGGMATVYLARDVRYNRQVAIKLLRPELGLSVAFRRFQDEIMLAASLTHPNIVPVFDSGGGADCLYYVMPFVEGESLRSLLDREHHLSLDRALSIIRDVGDALVYAHARQIIHRDIKPENILIVHGRAVLADFGIARAVEAAAADATRLTRTGAAVGTPLYMSPEQASGDTQIDERSDVYSLAIVLYEMLAGSAPHHADTPQHVLVRKLADPVPHVRNTYPDLPPSIDDALVHALAAEPSQRTATVAEFLNALRMPRVGAALRRVRARPRAIAIGAVALVVVAMLAALAIRARGPRASAAANRRAVAVFPFRTTVAQQAGLAEAVPDLLSTALDGTPGIRVVDPWTAWRPLRTNGQAAAHSPDVGEAASLARALGAGSFVLGEITQIGGQVEVTARIYRGDGVDPVAKLAVNGSADSVFQLVRSLAVDAIRTLAAGQSLPATLDRSLSKSPDAIKAWLRAREFQRRGAFDSAEVAIDRAVALDSNFAMALVDAAAIKTWAEFGRGQQYSGLRALAERAVRLTDSASDRPRLRARAMLASINTDGPTAAAALTQLIAEDSSDYEAWQHLTYVRMAYGWQYGATDRDAVDAAEHTVRLDSTAAPAIAQRLYLALALDDSADIVRQVARARRSDTSSALLAGLLQSYDALVADDRGFAAMLPRLVALPTPEWIAMFRLLRYYRPDRSARMIAATVQAHGSMQPLLMGAEVQLAGAEGRWHAIDSLRRAGAFQRIPAFDRSVDREIIAGAIAGMGNDRLAREAVASLAAGHPPDSALAQFTHAPIWQDGWLIGAYAAMYGDTLLAHRWQVALGTLPTKGASPKEFTTALIADIGARLAARRGDRSAALIQARRAFDAWDIHSDNEYEFTPEPAMRFHLAELLQSAGKADSALALYRSLDMPTTYVGFYTTRSSLALGELLDRAGDHAAAHRYYLAADRALAEGDSASIGDLRERARRGLAGAERTR